MIKIMTDLSVFARILAYMAKNRIKAALEADISQKVVVEATTFENLETKENGNFGQTSVLESHMLGYIYYDKPLGFEKHPIN